MSLNVFRFFCFFLVSVLLSPSGSLAQELPVYKQTAAAKEDWLLKGPIQKAGIYRSADGKDIILDNGLVTRVFRIEPNLACVDYRNLTTGRQQLRAVREEARVQIDGNVYNVGGLHGQKEKAYLLPEWLDTLTSGPEDFQYVSYEVRPILPTIAWKRTNWTSQPKGGYGKMISFLFRPGSASAAGISVKVQYELYDDLPLIVKSLQVTNNSNKVIKINHVVNEVLATVEEESTVAGTLQGMRKPQGIYFETNYAFNNSMNYANSDQTTHWKADSTYTSQVHYEFKVPCLLEVYPEKGPGVELQPGESFRSVRTHELMIDNDDRERRGLAIRRMYRAVAPWVFENPIFMHLVSRNDDEVRTAVDQCAATGYEAVIISFGGHLDMEDTSSANLQRWKGLADYAHSKHIKIGCYSLFSSRSISPDNDVIDPATGKPNTHALFEHAPCFGSRWGLWYRDNIKHFFTETGFDLFENDGPYPGDVCASTSHPGHRGLDDSQWKQIEIQKELYHWLNEHGVYINAPDWYQLDGSNKIALGYREVNFSLPRENQKILNRQNIYDGTWEKAPSMSWGFVPLTAYQRDNPDAVLEPLSEHLKDYEQLMMQYYGAGIQACYRGPRLYDTEETKATVIKVINWYKQYRDILNSDIIHLRRADGRDWDGILHVNPALNSKGLMMLFNPTKEKITRTIKVPLYHTGLKKTARVSEKGIATHQYTIKDDRIEFTFSLEPEAYTWVLIE